MVLNCKTQKVSKKWIKPQISMPSQKDKNHLFGDTPNERILSETRILFINANGLNIESNVYSLNEVCTKSEDQKFNILMLSETNIH